MARQVVITGIGVIAPNGATTAAFWENCLKGVAAVAPLPSHWEAYASYSSRIWAPLPEIDFTRGHLSRIEAMQTDRSAQLAVAAAGQALQDAGIGVSLSNEKKNTYSLSDVPSERCGVFIGTGIGGITSYTANMGNHLYAPLQAALRPGQPDGSAAPLAPIVRFVPRFHPFAVPMSMTNTAAATLGIKFSLQGPNVSFGNACAAGTTAIGQAFRAIRDESIDVALGGGVEFLGDQYGGIFRGFDIARTLVASTGDPGRANRPFDAARSGFLFAEGGCAVLVLESLEHAAARGGRPLAEIVSYAETFDAHSIMSPDPAGDQILRMLRQLLSSAGCEPGDIDYINTHGTGTLVNDEIEAGIIERIFGDRPLVNATKSFIGHTIGAAGAIEAAVTALSLFHQKTHACHNLQEPIRPLNFVRQSDAFAIRTGLSQSFAFGGHNAGLLMRRVAT
jgi:3-oxoacyl-[acyl-carrier-protein] synthase II